MNTPRLSSPDRNLRTSFNALAVSVLFLLSMQHADSAIKTWDGSSSGLWSAGANWAGGVAPQNGDQLRFPGGVSRRTVTNDIANLRIIEFLFNGAGASNYVVRGNAFTLADNGAFDGVIDSQSAGTNRIECDIVLAPSAPRDSFILTIGGSLGMAGNITLGGETLILRNAGTGDLEMSGAITGTGDVIVRGDSTFKGNFPNSYTGPTTVESGTLRLGKSRLVAGNPVPVQSIPGDLVIGVGVTGPKTVELLVDDQIGNASDVTIRSTTLQGTDAATLDLNGHSDAIGSLILSKGRVTEGGTLTLNGDVVAVAGVDLSSVAANLALGGASRGFIVTNNAVDPDLEINGVISGTGGITKDGPGTLSLLGNSGNTYSGITTVNAGVLLLGKSAGFAIIGTDLIIGDGAGSDVVRYMDGNQLRSVVDIQINRSGVLDLNGFNDDVGDISLLGGTIQTGLGTLSILATVSATASSSGLSSDPSRITGNLNLGTVVRTFMVDDFFFLNGAPTDLIVNAVISGTGGITKTGGGEMLLNAPNTYTGSTTVNDGALIVANDDALGSAAPGTVVNNPGRIELTGGISISSEPLTLNTSATGPGAVFGSGASNFWGGNVFFNRTTAIGVDQGSILNLGGTLSGPGGFEKEDFGQLIFTGTTSNTFAGLSFVKEGTLFCNKSSLEHSIPGDLVIGDGVGTNIDLVFYSLGQINNQSRVTVASTGRLLLGADTIGSLDGDGTVEIFNTGELRTGGNNASTTFDGVILGGGGLAKRGTGVFTLNGINTYTGPTFVEAGTLVVNGTQAGSDVTVRTNATLAGNGAVGDLNLATGGNLSPGLSPGRLSALNTVASNDATIRIELRGPLPAVDYDQLRINGTLNLTGSKLLVNSLLTNTPPIDGQVFMLIDNNSNDAITGSFDSLPNGTLMNVAEIPMRLNYNGGTGNDVTLTVTNLPARAGGFALGTGNGDGLVSPDECNTLFLVVSTGSASALASVVGTLSSPTPGVIITEGSAAYGNIPSNQRRTNATPFQFSTTAPFTCGRSIEFLLTVRASNQPPYNVRYVLQSGSLGASQTFAGAAIGLPGSGTVASPAVVTGVTGGIARVTVSMVLQHPNLGELIVNLVSPSGTGVVLFSPLGGTQMGNNCAGGRATFDDDALLPISGGASPFVGTFRPLVPLSNLDGRSGSLVNGVWQLQVVDVLGNAQPGALSCWSLTITPATCAPGGGICAPCNGPFFGAITTNDAIETVVVSGVGPTTCAFDPCSALTLSTGAFSDIFTFTNGGSAACVTVTLDAPCASPTNAIVSSAVLLPPFDTDGCTAPIGMSGLITNSPAAYTFKVPANAVFRVNVSGGRSGLGLCSGYTLRADGFDCAVPLGVADVAPGLVSVCWPSFGSAFQLECATSLAPPVWFAVTNRPVSIGGQLCVTNLQSLPEQFYRLRR